MLNFGLKHRHSSGWHKKFPRRKIEHEDPKHLGMHQHLRLRNEWFEGRQGYLSTNEIRKFLEANLGKNVDKVFSEFIKRAKRYKHDSNLKERFFREFNPNHRYYGEFDLDSQNRIIRRKKSAIKRISSPEAQYFNYINYPYNIKQYLRDTGLVLIGYLYLKTRQWNWEKAPVYVCNKEWYDLVMDIGIGKKYVTMANMTRVHLHIDKDIAMGIPKSGYSEKGVLTGRTLVIGNYDYKEHKYIKIPYTIEESNSKYIFLTNREGDWSSY